MKVTAEKGLERMTCGQGKVAPGWRALRNLWENSSARLQVCPFPHSGTSHLLGLVAHSALSPPRINQCPDASSILAATFLGSSFLCWYVWKLDLFCVTN